MCKAFSCITLDHFSFVSETLISSPDSVEIVHILVVQGEKISTSNAITAYLTYVHIINVQIDYIFGIEMLFALTCH